VADAHAAQGLGLSRGAELARGVAPKLLAVDLDGTLLDPRGQPHERDVRALQAALAEGVCVSILTGRLYSGTRPTVEVVGLRGAVGCADGSHLVRAHDHETLLHLGVRGDAAQRLRGAFARAGIATFVFARDAIGHDAGGAQFVDYVATWSKDVRLAPDVFQHELWKAEDGVTAVVAIGDEEQVTGVVGELRAGLAGAVMAVSFPLRRGAHAGRWGMIVRSAAGTKGTALAWIAKHEGVALADTVCVGDWVNDVPMFEAAGRSFVMGQAPDEVKAKGTDVLEETAENGGGVARAVETAFGIRVP
jgi:hydroxymethylpyrimidine pyrophosphatase-like HAD family hydrolase